MAPGDVDAGGTLARYLRWQLAAFSIGAAAIHFAEVPTHREEWWLFGAFFVGVAWFQAWWAFPVVTTGRDRTLVLGIAVNAVVIGIWIWSRTVGLPIGPDAGEPEAVGAADLLATVLEALLVGWAIGALLPAVRGRRGAPTIALVTTTLVWIVVIAATAFVFFAAKAGPGGH